MDTTALDATVHVVEAIAAFVSATGIGAAVVRYVTAKGIDVHAVLNNQFVQAAENAAVALVTGVSIQGKSIMDPAVIESIVTALAGSLMQTHAATISALAATPADVSRIASNAVLGAVPSVSVVPDPATAISQAVGVLSKARDALSPISAVSVAAPVPVLTVGSLSTVLPSPVV